VQADTVYVCSQTNGTVTAYDAVSGAVQVPIANGLNSPTGLAVDASGNLYISDFGNNVIRKITPAAAVTTYAGNGVQGWNDGPAASAEFYLPHGICLDGNGNVYVSDYGNNIVRRITPAGVVSTLAGNGIGGL